MFHIPKSEGVQEELNMIHYPRAAACIFTRLRAEESSDFIEVHCGVREGTICGG